MADTVLSTALAVVKKLEKMKEDNAKAKVELQLLIDEVTFLTRVLESSGVDDNRLLLANEEFSRLKTTLKRCEMFAADVKVAAPEEEETTSTESKKNMSVPAVPDIALARKNISGAYRAVRQSFRADKTIQEATELQRAIKEHIVKINFALAMDTCQKTLEIQDGDESILEYIKQIKTMQEGQQRMCSLSVLNPFALFFNSPEPRVVKGTAVEVNYRGTWNWQRGKVARVFGIGLKQQTFDINYDNGMSELDVTMDRIRILDAEDLIEHAKVVCNFKGKGTWCTGKIISVNSDGTYDVLFNDGGREMGVEGSRNHLRVFGLGDKDQPSGSFPLREIVPPSSTVEIRDRGQVASATPLWHSGKVTAAFDNHTYNVLYDNGKEEAFVRVDRIRLTNVGELRTTPRFWCSKRRGGASQARLLKSGWKPRSPRRIRLRALLMWHFQTARSRTRCPRPASSYHRHQSPNSNMIPAKFLFVLLHIKLSLFTRQRPSFPRALPWP